MRRFVTTELIEKAVWLDSLERVHNVIKVLDQLYGPDMWLGGLLFRDIQGGFLLVVTLNPDTYIALGTPWENLFPANHLRPITLVEACTDWRRYRPWLDGEICTALRHLRLLPWPYSSVLEEHALLAQLRAERDPPAGLP
jgi:hypothetical protein